MRQRTNKSFMHCYPGMVAVVTAQYNGETNVMAAGWHSYLSVDPPMYGVAVGKTRYTHHLIEGSKSFAIHFLPAEDAEIIQKTGVYSGQEEDKLKELKLSFDPGQTIEAPILHKAYVVYECQVDSIVPCGDHDWFVGHITAFYRDERYFDQYGLPNWEKAELPLYLGRSEYYIANCEGRKETYRIDN